MRRSEEPLLSIWGRRAVTVPALLALAAVVFAAAPVWGLGALVVDLATAGGRRLPRTRALAFFALYLGCEVAGIAGAFAVWAVTLGGRLGGPGGYLERNAALQRLFSHALFHGSCRIFSMRVVAEGLDLAKSGPFLLFVRHASTADTVVSAALVANPSRLVLRYVVKRELLRKLPALGAGRGLGYDQAG